MKKNKLSLALFAAVLFLFASACTKKTDKKILVSKDIFLKMSSVGGLEVEKLEHFYAIKASSDAQIQEIKHELHHLSHEMGRCGGYTEDTDEEIARVSKILSSQDDLRLREGSLPRPVVSERQDILDIISDLKTENIEESVKLLSSFETRSASADKPDLPIDAFFNHINKSLEGAKLAYSIEKLSHKNNKQSSIKVRIEGTDKPEDVIVLGGHIDSTNSSFFNKKAPGADDNASGSSTVLEVLRSLAHSDWKPKKSLEFMWYAAEEKGLLGSKEIAKAYHENSVNVVAVMQLDMVLFPGSGDVINLIEDFTNARLNNLLESLVDLYIKVPVLRSKCGYGCSDHASWHRNGFKAVFPSEATFRGSNKNIHTTRDVIDNRSSFDHALRFAKLAVSFMMEVSNGEALAEPTPEVL